MSKHTERLQHALGCWLISAVVISILVWASPAKAVEWKKYESKKYGFTMKVPKEFKLQSEEKGVTFMYQAGEAASGSSKSKKKKKGFKVGLRVKGVSLGHSRSEEDTTSSSGSGGGLDSAMTIYVNWAWMPDVSSATMYKTNLDSDKKDMKSPDPNYTDIETFAKKNGYAHEGNAYWYKETKKQDFEEIHRWHIKAYGNKSAYTVGLCGVYRQFDDWGGTYEEVVKSFKLIPIEK